MQCDSIWGDSFSVITEINIDDDNNNTKLNMNNDNSKDNNLMIIIIIKMGHQIWLFKGINDFCHRHC